MSYTTSDQKYLLTLFGLGVNFFFFFTFSNNATMNWIFQQFQKYQSFLIDIICLLQLFRLLNCLVQLMRAHADTSFLYANTTKSSIKNTKGWGATKQSISNNNTICTFTFPSGKDVTMINCIQGPARHFFFFTSNDIILSTQNTSISSPPCSSSGAGHQHAQLTDFSDSRFLITSSS